jgi:hypothetical protein
MGYKDPERRRSYNREYQRLRRAGQPTGSRGIEVIRVSNLQQTETARGLLRILGRLIGDVLESEQGDVFMKARTVAYVVSVALRAVETSDLETRVSNLENKIMGGQK